VGVTYNDIRSGHLDGVVDRSAQVGAARLVPLQWIEEAVVNLDMVWVVVDVDSGFLPAAEQVSSTAVVSPALVRKPKI